MFQLKMFQEKLESYQKNDKFVKVNQKFVYFIGFIFFMNTKLSVDSCYFLSSNLPNKKKMMQHRKR